MEEKYASFQLLISTNEICTKGEASCATILF
jgi:hypothetical protein